MGESSNFGAGLLALPPHLEPREEHGFSTLIPTFLALTAMVVTPALRFQADFEHQQMHAIEALLGRVGCGPGAVAHQHGHAHSGPAPAPLPVPAPCCGGKQNAAIMRRTGLKAATAMPT